MTGQAGGRADKLGNAYEKRWVVMQALRVLEGEKLRSLLWEALGEDERGVDLWVQRADGVREAHQCKRKNKSEGKWSLADLNQNGVLLAAKHQLSRRKNHRYVLVSADRTPMLDELSERARTCNDNPKLFRAHHLESKRWKRAFEELCRYWRCDPDDECDVRLAMDWLQRMECRFFDLETKTDQDIDLRARYLVHGDPSSVVKAVEDLVEQSLGNTIFTDSIWRHLRKKKLPPRDLSKDANLVPAVERLRNRFRRSLEHLIIDGSVLPRSETKHLLDRIRDDAGPRLIWVHGNAGSGKSGVLYELVQQLERDGVPYLPLRLDRQLPAQTPDRFGRECCGLPASPTLALRALAGPRASVLILDQLDAVRWSSAHTSDAWDVCTETIEEALCEAIGGRMRVVVTCRTFELNDPEVKHWKTQQARSLDLLVGELSESEIAVVLSRRNTTLESMSPRQRSLLKTPQGLYMWCEIQKSSPARDFSTFIELMRMFWEDRWTTIQKMGTPVEHCKNALALIVQHMDKRSSRSLPASRIPEQYHGALKAFRSLNVIDQNPKLITFAHQSYADYLIAQQERNAALREERQPLEWVHGHDQSLFRRDQLRQLLTLLREDDQPLYLRTMYGLLLGEGVRFHLQHLALRLLSTWSAPLDGEIDLLVELYKRPAWIDFVVRWILWSNDAFVEAFVQRGVFQSQLASADDLQVNIALFVMRGVTRKLGGLLDRLLDLYWTAEEPWPERIRSVMPHSPEGDTNKMFAFRLRCTRAGAHNSLYFDEKWAGQAPIRCLKLTDAYIRSYVQECRRFSSAPDGNKPPRWTATLKGEGRALMAACLAAPARAWTTLAACVEAISTLRRRQRYKLHASSYTYQQGMSRACAFLRRLLVVSGGALASTSPRKFVKVVEPYIRTKSGPLRRAILQAVGHGGHRLADVALSWLCDLPQLLRAGTRRSGRYDGSRWAPAFRLIRQLTPLCSDSVYRRLEDVILSYREPDELVSCRRKLEQARHGHGCFPNRVGLAQNVLLAALPTCRMSIRARAMAGIWREKFGPPVFHAKEPRGLLPVVSPIPTERVAWLSDRHWLSIINRSWPQKPTWVLSKERIGGVYREASPEHFATDLARMAACQPGRFAALALHVSPDSGQTYLGRLLGSLTERRPSQPELPGAVAGPPATHEQLERLLEHVGYSADYEVATAFCDIVGNGADEMWPDTILSMLARYASEHPDPGPDEHDRDLSMIELNCVRGRAAHTIGSLLFEQPDLLQRFLPTIHRLVRDPEPAVRLAAVRTCGPILSIDRDLAVELFMQACAGGEAQLVASHRVHHFIRSARYTHWSTLVSLIQRMVNSTDEKASEAGTTWMVVTGLEAGFGVSQMSQYVRGAPAHRKGCAVAAVALAERDARVATCRELLLCLFDDDSEEVRKEAGTIFHHHNLYPGVGFDVFAGKYVHSRAFADDPWVLVRGLASHRGSLIPFSQVIHDICANLAAAPSNRSELVADDLSVVLLRLYEQSQGRGDRLTQERCLDGWDLMLKRGTGGTRDQLAALDA